MQALLPLCSRAEAFARHVRPRRSPQPTNIPLVYAPFDFTCRAVFLHAQVMATLSSNSTDAEVWAAYDDNASYEEDGSRAKALAFVTACRILRRRLPLSAGRGPQSVTRESLDAEISAAKRGSTPTRQPRAAAAGGSVTCRWRTSEDDCKTPTAGHGGQHPGAVRRAEVRLRDRESLAVQAGQDRHHDAGLARRLPLPHRSRLLRRDGDGPRNDPQQPARDAGRPPPGRQRRGPRLRARQRQRRQGHRRRERLPLGRMVPVAGSLRRPAGTRLPRPGEADAPARHHRRRPLLAAESGRRDRVARRPPAEDVNPMRPSAATEGIQIVEQEETERTECRLPPLCCLRFLLFKIRAMSRRCRACSFSSTRRCCWASSP